MVDHGQVIGRHELTDQDWELLAPLMPRAAAGRPRAADRQVVNGMVYKIRAGVFWRDLPERYGPWKTVCTRFRRYALDGVFTRALQHIQAQTDPRPAHRPGRPRCRPDQVIADKAYSSRGLRAYLRRRDIAHTIPEKRDQQRHRHNRGRRGGRPPGFDRDIYRRRNVVERCFNRLKGFRGIATRYEKTATSYEAAVTLASFLLWARSVRRRTLAAAGVSAWADLRHCRALATPAAPGF